MGLRIAIATPALADANNGNWQTARRWQSLLRGAHTVRLLRQWPDGPAAAQDDVLLALHARRSAASIAAWAQARGAAGLAVVLTGTDLYRDIATDPHAQRSLQLAARLVVLQGQGLAALPAPLRAKACVLLQSTTARAPLARKPTRWLRAVMVGHLRAAKSPQTLFEAARLLADAPGIRIDHIGAALGDTGEAAADWAALARATEAACPGYRWLGGQPHGVTRRAIQRAHVLVHTSAMEGGAHVIMEAVRSGTPVIASRIDGNVGMLGADYAGYFAPGDAAALAALLLRLRREQLAPPAGPAQHPTHNLSHRLHAQCALRAPLFEPAAERAALLQLIADLHLSFAP